MTIIPTQNVNPNNIHEGGFFQSSSYFLPDFELDPEIFI